MFGIFVHDSFGGELFSTYIVNGLKTIETRNRDTLKSLVGKQVAVIRTMSGQPTMIVGYVDIVSKWFCPAEKFLEHAAEHRVFPGSKFYPHNKPGKWMYELRNNKPLDVSAPLPKDVIYHGRAYCEF